MTNTQAINELKIVFLGEYDEQRTAKDLAILALEKQIPKKVKDARTVADLEIGFCPICGDGSNSEFNYCPICGQKLDWSEDDKTEKE